MTKALNKAIAAYTAESTPAAVRKAVRITNRLAGADVTTAADVRQSALYALREAVDRAIAEFA
jgi:murein tripeptide amidase MpaA